MNSCRFYVTGLFMIFLKILLVTTKEEAKLPCAPCLCRAHKRSPYLCAPYLKQVDGRWGLHNRRTMPMPDSFLYLVWKQTKDTCTRNKIHGESSGAPGKICTTEKAQLHGCAILHSTHIRERGGYDMLAGVALVKIYLQALLRPAPNALDKDTCPDNNIHGESSCASDKTCTTEKARLHGCPIFHRSHILAS